jgi:hypothetical protein
MMFVQGKMKGFDEAAGIKGFTNLGGLIAMQLPGIEESHLLDIINIFRIEIDGDADPLNKGGEIAGEIPCFVGINVTGTLGVKVESESIRTCMNRGMGIGFVGNSTNLDSNHPVIYSKPTEDGKP